MDTKISVIVPTYNNEDYLQYAMDSVINQTFGFENIELILVDDKSTDKTSEIINGYAKKYDNIVPIFRDVNSGSPNTPRNDGLKVAKSKYIMFLDHDDEYAPEMCEKMYDSIESNDLDCLHCRIKLFTKENDKIIYIHSENEVHNQFFDNDFDSSVRIFEKNEINLNNMATNLFKGIFKKSFLYENNICFPDDDVGAEDFLFVTMVYTFVNKYGLLNYTGYFWKIHPDSYGHSLKFVLKSFKGIYLAYLFSKKHDDNEVIKFALKLVSDLVIFFVNGNNLSYDIKKQLVLQYWDLFESFNDHIDDYHFSVFYKFLMKILTYNKKITLFLIKAYTLLHLWKIIKNPIIQKYLTGKVNKNRR
ncbi:MAG: glycosyltransferase family 2 protein [Methanobrevibacter sp.]|jgi:glycosyltransferase involved in cell wall biosynthesis|nr:glycosyltransferase family 2 protein [Candidatus Methanoflexus mossambicus]